MAGECSFDVVSQFDEQELVNALDQTRREVQTRYDLKDTKTEIVHSKDNITIVTDSEFTLKSVRDILETKAIRRGLSLKIFKPGKEENAAGGRVRQVITLQQGLSQDLAKESKKPSKLRHSSACATLPEKQWKTPRSPCPCVRSNSITSSCESRTWIIQGRLHSRAS